ncbi:MAG: hypothetical protein WDW38_009909 [Sanguina aurantia]
MGTERLTGTATAHVSVVTAGGISKLASLQGPALERGTQPGPTQNLSSPTPTQVLVTAIQAAFSAEKALGHAVNASQPTESFLRLDGTVRELLRQYSMNHAEEWRRYEFFNEHHYVRNLVDDCEDFELIVLCWKKGQGSRVHNHAQSHCWLHVMQGTMVEALFAPPSELRRSKSFNASAPNIPGVISSEAPCPFLMEVAEITLKVGDIGYISDASGLHSIRCCDADPEQADGITLHLYSPPIKRVTLYEPDEGVGGRVVQRTPGFYTVRGVRQ